MMFFVEQVLVTSKSLMEKMRVGVMLSVVGSVMGGGVYPWMCSSF